MNFLALACDYDGTLAYNGKVRQTTVCALEELRQSGRKLLLVTGRELDPLLAIFPRHNIFEWIVAENGGLLYCPQTRESRLLTEPVPQAFPDTLRQRGVEGVSVGKAIVATWRPHECRVLDVVRELGLDRQIIFNKDAVMVLPTGVNKASGLTTALEEMKISHHNVVAVGDAENDIPMLTQCECGVAVENAVASVKDKADFVTRTDHGIGVEELIVELLQDDLRSRMATLHSNGILLGKAKNEPERACFYQVLATRCWLWVPRVAASRPRLREYWSVWRRRATSFACSIRKETTKSSTPRSILAIRTMYLPQERLWLCWNGCTARWSTCLAYPWILVLYT